MQCFRHALFNKKNRQANVTMDCDDALEYFIRNDGR